ncbi:hypothetical protein DFH09DRAFT_1172513 [Mycena vulgaris]|nr:hypothetical protein DFH09DRAFT_1172513 [Mycena vulgaris]
MDIGGDVPWANPPIPTTGDGPAEVRCIDLPGHPQLLEFSQLRTEETAHHGKATFVVRDEYKWFIQHTLSLSLYDGPAPRCSDSSSPESWVLIDADQEWMPNKKYAISPFVIWTSSPRDSRWQYFRKTFKPSKRWFMKPWSTKEIAAAACVFCFCCGSSGGTNTDLGKHSDRLGSAHGDVTPGWSGAARSHATSSKGTPHRPGGEQQHRRRPLRQPVRRRGHPARSSSSQWWTSPRAGGLLRRVPYSRRGCKDLRARRESDGPVAAVPLPGVRHALHAGSRRQARRRADAPLSLARHPVFGRGAVAATLELLGKADVFVPKGVPTTERPLYLRPLLLPSSPPLPNGADVKVKDLDGVVYCLVGSSAHRVQGLVRAARATLTKLKELSEDDPKMRWESQPALRAPGPACFGSSASPSITGRASGTWAPDGLGGDDVSHERFFPRM